MPVPITASFGIADLATSGGDKEMIAAADAALQRAKANGRNRSVVADASFTTSPAPAVALAKAS